MEMSVVLTRCPEQNGRPLCPEHLQPGHMDSRYPSVTVTATFR